MMIPATYGVALLLTILTMICWGSWANTVKFAGSKWRFELFYFDFSIGMALVAVLAALTFGSIENAAARSSDRVMFGFVENFYIASNLRMLYAFLAGAVFNLANMLLVAAIAVAGLAVAFPVGIGLALVIGVGWSYILNPQGRPELLFGGSAVVLGAIVMCALAHRTHLRHMAMQAAKAAAEKEEHAAAHPAPAEPAPAATHARSRSTAGAQHHAAPRTAKPTVRTPAPWKGVIISLISGLLMGSFFPLLELSKATEFGLGPYLGAVIFALGILATTPVYNLFFMNLPVQGQPVSFMEYFKGNPKQHLWGLLGGALWMAGGVANFAAASAPKSAHVGPAVSYAIGQGATLVSTLWGLLYWKEFKDANQRTNQLIITCLVLFVVGLAMVAVAPLF